MPRPCKRRRVCTEPECSLFLPDNRHAEDISPIKLALDEFESVRLIDLEGMTQEECARQMNIARTTVQAIYNSARIKIAECLVNGRGLEIGGGEYELCGGDLPRCPHGHGCPGKFAADIQTHQNRKDDNTVKIAVTYENGQVFQHFGHTERFKIYDVQDGKVVSSAVVSSGGSGHGALAGMLASSGVDVLICGGIGGGAQMALMQAGIKLYGGVSGDADAAVEALLAGELDYNPNVHCDHHDNQHGSCGEHSCADHICGGHCGH